MSTLAIVNTLNDQHGYRLDPAEVADAKNKAYLKHIRQIKPIEPVVEIVRKFHGKLPMGLGTGEIRSIAEQNIHTIGLAKYFSAMVTCEDVRKPKPDPETFLRCADLLDVANEYCQVFEDGELGLEAARRAGMVATDVRPFLKAAEAEAEISTGLELKKKIS